MSFNGNLMRATAVEANLIADLEARLTAAELAREESDLAAEQMRVQAALSAAHEEETRRENSRLSAENRALRRLAEDAMASIQVLSGVAVELAALTEELAPAHDAKARQLVANAYRAAGKTPAGPSFKVAV